MIRAAATLFTIALLAGCAADSGHYPSLAVRPAEKQGFAEPVSSPAPVLPDPALDTRLAEQGASLDRIAAGFSAAAAVAQRGAEAAARQPVGSEAWLGAQAALARLDDWRAQASALTAEIEAAGSARAATLQPAYPALDTLRDRAAAETERQAGTAARLQALLPSA